MQNYDFLKGQEGKIVVCRFGDKWKQEREKFLYTGKITNQNLRQILDNEIIIEFDHKEDWKPNSKEFKSARKEAERWIQNIKRILISMNYYFYITDHNGKSPHIRLQIKGLEEYPKQYALEYKSKLVEDLLKDIKFKSNVILLDSGLITSSSKLISLEHRPHFKEKWKREFEKVIYEHEGAKKPNVNRESMEELIQELNQSLKLDNKEVNLDPIDIKDVIVEGLIEIWKEHYTEGQRNALLLAFGGLCRRKGIELEDAKKLLKTLLLAVGKSEYYPRTSKELAYSYQYDPQKVAVYKHLKKIWNEERAKKVYHSMKKCFENKEEYKPYSLDECKKVIHKWLLIEDDNIIDIIFAFSIAEKLSGDPLWLFLIAPPGGCKTEILRAIVGQDYYHLSDLTSKTFVSGLMLGKGKERRKIEDLLPQLNKKVLVFKDFTTVLEKNKDERREIIAQLREIYDGSFAKKFGTLDKKVEYETSMGFIAGVTPIIDKHWKIMQQLGERFLKYRWAEDEDKTTRKAEENEGKEKEMRKEIKKAVMGYLSNLKIINPSFPNEFTDSIIAVSKFLALCRTPITIHGGQTDFYYDFIPTPERPTRLVKQLKKLSKSLACVRSKSEVDDKDVLSVIEIALSTAPQDRLDILKAIEELQHNTLEGCTISQIMSRVKLPETSIRNVCQQLNMLELVNITKVTKEAYGNKEYIQYYKLSQKISALSPQRFLEYSKKRGGDNTEEIPLNWDDRCKIHSKCTVQGCNETICNFNSTNIPYCKKHFEEMAI